MKSSAKNSSGARSAPRRRPRARQPADLAAKARQVWEQTLRIHARAPDTRVASSLSCVEILVALYYGGLLRFRPGEPRWEGRDRFIASKGHGSISLYPILADLGFFPAAELARVGQDGSFLGGIPDPIIPGYETVNGSLGHGLGVGCGIAMALQRKRSKASVVVLLGDGELYEGAVWEAIMLAGHHRLANLTAIVDQNGRSILGDCRDIIDLQPLARKFAAFRWIAREVDGHDVYAVQQALRTLRAEPAPAPRVLIARTVKGRGVPRLEASPLCHVLSLSPEEVEAVIASSHA